LHDFEVAANPDVHRNGCNPEQSVFHFQDLTSSTQQMQANCYGHKAAL